MNGIVLAHTEWRDKGRGGEGRGGEEWEKGNWRARGGALVRPEKVGKEIWKAERERQSGGSQETEEKWEAGQQGRPQEQRLVNKRMDGADRTMLNGARGHLISSYGFYQDELAGGSVCVCVCQRVFTIVDI